MACRLFQQDPTHPSLQFKRVLFDPPIDPARVGIAYRVLGTMHGEEVVWFWIGSHAEYDQILDQL